MDPEHARRGERAIRGAAWAAVFFLITVVFTFAAIRVSQDVPAVFGSEPVPAGSFEERYAEHPVPAYAHILPGVVFLAIAPFQLSTRFRRARLRRHRLMGRIAATAALMSGLFAILIGVWFPFGGVTEATAAVVFGVWFMLATVSGVRAARSHDETTHRRWMIRVVAIGVGVGSIRIVIGISQAFGGSFEDIFGPAFWIALVAHAAVAELWLRWRPFPARAIRSSP